MLSLRNGSPVTGGEAICREDPDDGSGRDGGDTLPPQMEPSPSSAPFEVPSPPPALTTPLPPPPPARAAPPAVRGQLSPGWTAVFWAGWLLIAASFVAVWASSRLVGLSTWWLGPATEPRFVLISLLPLVFPLGLCIGGLRRAKWLPWWGVGGAAATALIAAFDIADVPGFAAVEFALAGAGLLVSLACTAGMYRRSR